MRLNQIIFAVTEKGKKPMTDNEIIKALECCSNRYDCYSCEYYNQYCKGDMNVTLKDALDLINRQKAEIEALIAGQETLQKYIVTAKAEAIKEFAERLKKNFDTYTDEEESNALYMINLINDLVKEMVGDNK